MREKEREREREREREFDRRHMFKSSKEMGQGKQLLNLASDAIFSRVLRDHTTRYVRPLVGPHFNFLKFLRSLASLLLPK